jgi:histidinol dehydrogenase
MLESIDGRETLGPVHITRPLTGEDEAVLAGSVAEIVSEVRRRGDAAVTALTLRFDGAEVPAERLRVTPDEIEAAREATDPSLLEALEAMATRLRKTAKRGLPAGWIDREAGRFTGELVVPLRRAGLYVPGGRASYPSSVIMAAIPAQVAGVEGIAVASPPGSEGDISSEVLAACSIAGVTEVYRMGGAQAIAAFAYGTKTVRPVEKIVGPGNAYVTVAKRLVQGTVGIDSEAGPTEIMVIAGAEATAEVIAADLIAQAEHGPHGSHVLVTWEPDLAAEVMNALDLQVPLHPRGEAVENALTEGGVAVLVRDLDQAVETANAFGPEHLQLEIPDPQAVLERIWNAGAVFAGPWTPVAVGDYAGTTDHVLPSGGTSRFSSGLSARDFVKTIYVSGVDRTGLEELAPHIRALAEAEGLPAHATSVDLRLDES